MSSDSDSEADSETLPPVALHLGDIVFAKSEWEALASIGELRVGPIQTAYPFHFRLPSLPHSRRQLFASLDSPSPEPER